MKASQINLFVTSIHALCFGSLCFFSALSDFSAPTHLTREDDLLVQKHLWEIAPPPALSARLAAAWRQALLLVRAQAEIVTPSTYTPVRIRLLMVSSEDILLATESHGLHFQNPRRPPPHLRHAVRASPCCRS